MVMNGQSLMPGSSTVAQWYHAELITTSNIAKMPGTYHIDFDVNRLRTRPRKSSAWPSRPSNKEIPPGLRFPM